MRLTRRSARCVGRKPKARPFARVVAVSRLTTSRSRRRFKCVACHHQFSVTSGTIFASRKLSFTDLLAAIVIFVNGAKGVSALQVSRDLDVQYKTAFVLTTSCARRWRASKMDRQLNGIVEIDGGYFGGHVKPENRKEDRKDRRLESQSQASASASSFASTHRSPPMRQRSEARPRPSSSTMPKMSSTRWS